MHLYLLVKQSPPAHINISLYTAHAHTHTHTHRMVQLLKPGPTKQYVDLTVSFENEEGEDIPGPPIRYYF